MSNSPSTNSPISERQTDTQQTELQKAAQNANPSDIADNLDPKANVASQNSKQPENLTPEQATPFIDDSLRTDK